METLQKWSLKELIYLLILTLVLCPILIETYAQSLLQDLFQNKLYSGTATGALLAIVFTTGVYLIALKPHGYTFQGLGLRSPTKPYYLQTIGWIFVSITASILLVVILEIIGVGADNEKTESLNNNMSTSSLLIGLISAAVVSPVYEEIFYRGFLYRWFRRYGVGIAMIVSSTIFMIVHIPTYSVLPLTFVNGLIYSWMYERTGSIVPAMIVHGGVNGIGVLVSALI
ncbi:CPBP family intramembrane glutamic endopeptidase [Salimicrobium halophilum]|uniref:CAAX prenyl protease 2/Lysostaphin resistance protein A-like domain-containing protein n=1 Tax=Salimicrobium halophilum TaxID=86666 RepID=A0A1G8UEN2_9BACI|nr:type II CAAX endopeptidase family protein [Salimicrobium halophilum]SDJ51625.1 hypothetical protein SAMN04490247_2185 [Salimicrobium halophilum]